MIFRGTSTALLTLFVLAGLSAVPVVAFAQDEAATRSADPGRVQQQFMERDLDTQVEPDVEVRNVIAQNVPEGAEDITFELREITLDGVTAYPAAELRSLYANKLGTTVSLADVYIIASLMTNKYRNDGYILTQVVVPPQTIEGGSVKLRVVEGFVASVTVEGEDDESALALIRRMANKIQTGRALNVADLERYLLLINDLPGVTARSVLGPSPTEVGGADLRIIVERDPFDGLLAIDNFGSRFLGPLQLTAAGTTNSFFGQNERITLQVVDAPQATDNEELFYAALTYDQPISDNGTTLSLTANRTITEPGYTLGVFGVRGFSDFYGATVSQSLIRSRAENLQIYGTFDYRNVLSKSLFGRTEDRIRSLRIGGNYQFIDTLFGAGINSIGVKISRGLGLLAASDPGDAGLSRNQGEPNYLKMNADFQRLQRITPKLNLMTTVTGQWSAHPLLSSEEFGVGGPILGRSFDPSEIIGDDGLAGSLELQWNEPVEWSFVQDYQLFSFWDAGTIWEQDATVADLKTETITSAGAGIRMDFKDDTEASFSIAWPLNREIATQQDDDPRVYMSLSRRF